MLPLFPGLVACELKEYISGFQRKAPTDFCAADFLTVIALSNKVFLEIYLFLPMTDKLEELFRMQSVLNDYVFQKKDLRDRDGKTLTMQKLVEVGRTPRPRPEHRNEPVAFELPQGAHGRGPRTRRRTPLEMVEQGHDRYAECPRGNHRPAAFLDFPSRSPQG